MRILYLYSIHFSKLLLPIGGAPWSSAYGEQKLNQKGVNISVANNEHVMLNSKIFA
jgi:hypothetical protein